MRLQARAASPSLVCRISGNKLNSLSFQKPGMTLKLLQYASARMCASLDNIEILTCRSVEQRLTRYLLRLYAMEGRTIQLPFNQRLLANQLGVRVETLNRTLSQWKKCGYLTCNRNHWQLINIDVLQRLGS
jgi:CRP-like cAMP-binding protein